MSIITVDLRSRSLIWEQIVDSVKQQIARGVLREDDYMPSVRSLANELGINPNTIQKAYAELERQGIIKSVPGKGSIVIAGADTVSGMQKAVVLDEVRSLAAAAAAAGVSFEEFASAAKSAFSDTKEDCND